MWRNRKTATATAGSAVLLASGRGVRLPPKFRAANFIDATFVQGGTLRRFWHRPEYEAPDEDGYTKYGDTVKYFLTRTPTKHQVATGCDRCPGRHQLKNLACSANFRDKESPLRNDAILYDFVDPVNGPKFHFRIIEEEIFAGPASVSGAWVVLYPAK